MEFELVSCDNICAKNDFNINCVPSLNKEKLSYNDFFTNFMLPNFPCIIKNVTRDWEASSKWLVRDGTPDLKYLKQEYGSCDVTVYDCNQRYFNSHQTENCKFSTFLETHWDCSNHNLKYLKDWHLKNTFKDDHFYQVPIYFASDWLNEFLTEKNDCDYRFVYMGGRHTWTPLHSDVFNSFSWSANVCGRKRWILFPPGEENIFRDWLNNLPYDVSDVYTNGKYYELIQNPGEAVFVPSGWFHQVWNLEDTISINHNWVNGCNINKMWAAIQKSLDAVKKEIADCRDMENFVEHCQIVLNASFGMDFYKFYDFLDFIAQRRLLMLHNLEQRTLFHGYTVGLNHVIFDLHAVRAVLREFVQHHDVVALLPSKVSHLEKIILNITTEAEFVSIKR